MKSSHLSRSVVFQRHSPGVKGLMQKLLQGFQSAGACGEMFEATSAAMCSATAGAKVRSDGHVSHKGAAGCLCTWYWPGKAPPSLYFSLSPTVCGSALVASYMPHS